MRKGARTPPRGGVVAAWGCLLAGAVLLAAAVPTVADTDVFFAPGLIQVDPGDEFEVTFRVAACDDSICLTQLYMSFDHTLIELLEATEGSLYVNCGYPTWPVIEEEEPGFWHLSDTTFGPGTCIVPPGELFYFHFRVLPGASGYSPVHADTVRMTDVRRERLSVASVRHGHVLIGDSGADSAPYAVSIGPAAPNPFVAATSIAFSVPDAAEAWSVDIYDLGGRLVRRLDVPSGARAGSLVWDGMNRSGATASSGVYFVRLSGVGRAAQTRIVKLN